MKKRYVLLPMLSALFASAALAEEGVRTAGSRLPLVVGGAVAIAVGVLLFLGMMAGRQRREVVVTPTGLPIPAPLFPLAIGVLVGVFLITQAPEDSYVLNGVRYRLGQDSARATGFAEGAAVPARLRLPAYVDGLPVKRVGGFSGSGLREIQLPATVNEIDNQAFRNCDALEEVRLSGLDRIGNRAFEGCDALRRVSLSDVEQVGARAFGNCPALERVELSGKIGSLANNAFANCPNAAVYSDDPAVAEAARKAGVER